VACQPGRRTQLAFVFETLRGSNRARRGRPPDGPGLGFGTSRLPHVSPGSTLTVPGTAHSTGRRLVRGATLMLMSEIAVRVLTIVSMLVVARLLGPAALGQLAIAQAVVAYAGVVGDGGLTTLTQRSMVREPARADRLVATTTSIQLALSALLVTAVLGASPVLPVDRNARHLVIVLSPLIVMQALNLFYVLQAREQVGRLAAVRTLGQVATASLGVTLVIATHSTAWVAVATWAGALLADMLCFGFIHAGGLRLRLPSWGEGKHLLRSSWPYLAIALLSWVLQNFDVLVIGATRSSREAGEYTAAYRFVLIAVGLSGLVFAVTFPELVRRYRDDLPAFSRFLAALVRQATRVGYAIAGLVAVAAPQIVSTLYGTGYRQSGLFLALLFLSVPVSYCNSILGHGLLAAGRERSYLGSISVTAAISIVALLGLVPRYGAVAAACVVLVGEFVTLTLFTVLFGRRLRVNPTRELLVQLPWLVVPVLSLMVLTTLWHRTPLYALVVAWLASVLIVELSGGRQLYRETIGLSRETGRKSVRKSV
jgi:O-antigen/teichoic acid export membrane protein